MTALGPGARLDHYVLLEKLGSGGMGVVYRARDERLGREVALKLLHVRHAADERSRERFRREVEAASAVRHPNLATLHATGVASGTTFLVLELLRGGSLRTLVRARGRLPWREAVALAVGIANGLAALHEAGIVHRDLKPDNVLLDDEGRPRVSDFGLVRRTGTEAASLTETGELVGTLEYMAPEQGESLDVDARADLYALGATLHELLTGAPPFRGTGYGLLKKHLTEAPPSVRSVAPEVPEPLARLVLRLLAKKPAERPATARAVARELEALLVTTSGGASRAPLAIALGLVVVVAGAGVAILASIAGRVAPPPPPPPVSLIRPTVPQQESPRVTAPRDPPVPRALTKRRATKEEEDGLLEMLANARQGGIKPLEALLIRLDVERMPRGDRFDRAAGEAVAEAIVRDLDGKSSSSAFRLLRVAARLRLHFADAATGDRALDAFFRPVSAGEPFVSLDQWQEILQAFIALDVSVEAPHAQRLPDFPAIPKEPDAAFKFLELLHRVRMAEETLDTDFMGPAQRLAESPELGPRTRAHALVLYAWAVRARDREAALAAVERAVRLDPGSGRRRFDLAREHVLRTEMSRAVEAFAEALAIFERSYVSEADRTLPPACRAAITGRDGK